MTEATETKNACYLSSDEHSISDRSVVEKASDGVLLKGFSFCGNLEKLDLKEKVLKLQKDVQLQMPWKIAHKYAHASLIASETLNEIYSFGFSAVLSIKQNRKDALKTHRESIKNDISQNNIRTIYSFLPSYSWEARTEDFCLDQNVLDALKTISLDIDQDMEETEIRCLDFVKKYGTHVLIGNVHFGRVTITAESMSLPQLQGSSTSFVCSCSDYKSSPSDIDFSQPCLEKHSLHVVDRDISKTENFVPIWRFILNESTIYKNKEIAEHIRRRCNDCINTVCFESLEKQTFHFSMCTLYSALCLQINERRYSAILRQFSQEVSRVENNVLQLISKGCDLLEKLLRTVKANTSKDQDILDVKRLFQTILKKSNEIEFAGKQDIVEWLRRIDIKAAPKCPEVVVNSREQLMKAMTSGQIVSAAKMISESECDIDRCITTVLSTTIGKLFEKLKSKNTDDFEYLFLLSCLIPFDFNFREDNTFRTLMTIPRLHNLHEKMCSKFHNFENIRDRSHQIHHAWVTHSLISDIIDTQSQVSLTISALPVEFQTNAVRLHKCIKTLLSRKGNLSDILRELSKMMDDERNEILSLRYLQDSDKYSTTLQSNCPAEEVTSQPLQPILHQLELKEFFPAKITIDIATAITEKTFSSPTGTPDIPWIMLRKIMSCDFTFREQTVIQSMSTQLHLQKDIMDSDSDDDEKDNNIEEKSEPEAMHPLDAFYALFICCDLFLKGVICRKLTEMQIAIPFSYPHAENTSMLSLWPMRHIYFGDSPHSLATTPFKIVTFMRVGDISFKSKSKLINEILRDQNEEHSTFFHRDCKLGTKSRDLYNGAIEAAWHTLQVPLHKSSSSENVYNDHTSGDKLLFLNLRGNAMIHKKEVDQLLLVSHILVVLLEYKVMTDDTCTLFMSKLHDRNVNILLITNNPQSKNEQELRSEMIKYKKEASVDKRKTKMILTFDCKRQREKNTVEVRGEVIQRIVDMLKRSEKRKTLEKCVDDMSRFPGAIIDERNPDCEFGKHAALDLFEKMREHFPGDCRKTAILPLQGKYMWQKLSREQKLLNAHGHTQKAVEKIVEVMEDIRKKQVRLCNSNEFLIMGTFTNTVLSLIEDKKKMLFFLSWFEKFLDQQSRFILPEFIRKLTGVYNLSKKEMQNTAGILKAEEDLLNASLGIEHFLREMGQMYESYHHCLDDDFKVEEGSLSAINKLPIIAAKLLLFGRSLEILDGDAVNVPLTWIKAVFKELENFLKGKRVFSLSVLGVQSSGKSTLLNTMFGLELPVSSGRCTKGVFLYLLPVHHTDLTFDYVMIFDTEGLGSPDQPCRKTKDDNKLATLAIGIADTVIINIKGETIGEMENVLQVVVHALMRLKQTNEKLNLRQSCIFVHQNVNLIDKSYNLRPDIQRTERNLDQITKEVAEHENMDYITCFSDVIAFESCKDVNYVTNLWHGHPPMAPKSPAYSNNVEKISKDVLLRCSKKLSSCLTVWDTFLRIESMWEGILAENFVFSFRNCLELKSYTMLQSEFQQLSWGLEQTMHMFWNKNVRPKLYKCTEKDIDLKCAEFQNSFTNKIRKSYVITNEKLEAFIDTSNLADHMVQWKQTKLNALTEHLTKIQRDFERKLKQQVMNQKLKLRNRDKETEESIIQGISDYAKSFKGQSMSNLKIDEKFQEKWRFLLTELACSTPIDTHFSKMRILETKMQTTLQMHFQTHHALLEKEKDAIKDIFEERSTRTPLSVDLSEIHDHYISFKSKARNIVHLIYKKAETMEKYKHRALACTREIYKQAIVYFSDQEHEDMEFGESHFQYLLNLVTNCFEDHNSKDPDFKFTHEYQIKISLRVAQYAFKRFNDLNIQFEEKHNLNSFLQSKKEKAKQVFLDIIQEKKDAEVASNYLCKEIRDQLQKYVKYMISMKLRDRMLQHFSFLKSNLITSMLADLAEEDDFQGFMKYIECPEKYARNWVKEKTLGFCFLPECNSFYTSCAMQILGQEISLITDTARRTSENKDIKSLGEWIASMCNDLCNFELDCGNSNMFQNCLVRDLKELCSIFKEKMSEMENELQEMFNSHSANDVVWEGKAPNDDIFDTLWGCLEHCPWCHEPCEITNKDHVQKEGIPHRCMQHRPFASSGIHTVHSQILVMECCNFKVQSKESLRCGKWCGCETTDCNNSHPFRNYKKYLPSWDIPPKTDISRFWCWFTKTYIDKLAEYYDKKFERIPRHWNSISKESAIRSLHTPFTPMRHRIIDILTRNNPSMRNLFY